MQTDLMANIEKKTKSIKAGNLNSCLKYLITTVKIMQLNR